MKRKVLCLLFVMSVAIPPAMAVAASGADGWPSAEAASAPKPAAKAAASKPAPPQATKSVATQSATPAPVAPQAPRAAAPLAVSAAVAPVVATGDLVKVLQDQSALLAQLAGKLDEQRHVIETQQAAIKALQAKPAAGVTASAVSASAAPAVAAPPPPPPILVDTGGMKLRMSGLFQGWYSSSNGGVDSFRLRRTEFKFSGDLGKRAKWTLMFDPAKALSVSNTTTNVGGLTVLSGSSVSQSGRILQDAFVSLTASQAFIVDLGQQKIPLSMEGVQSSGRLETIERALFMSDKTRGGGWGDVRDLGLMVRGKVAGGQVEYFTGLFNGLGEAMNDVDKNDQKDVVGRVVFHPKVLKGFQFGGSFARDSFGAATATLRTREGLEMLYTRNRIAFKSEFMEGRDGPIERHGGYGQMTAQLHKSLTALFRFDMWDPDTQKDTTADTVTERDWLAGVTYAVPSTNVALQFNFIRKTFGDVSAPKNVFMANLQTNW